MNKVDGKSIWFHNIFTNGGQNTFFPIPKLMEDDK